MPNKIEIRKQVLLDIGISILIFFLFLHIQNIACQGYFCYDDSYFYYSILEQKFSDFSDFLDFYTNQLNAKGFFYSGIGTIFLLLVLKQILGSVLAIHSFVAFSSAVAFVFIRQIIDRFDRGFMSYIAALTVIFSVSWIRVSFGLLKNLGGLTILFVLICLIIRFEKKPKRLIIISVIVLALLFALHMTTFVYTLVSLVIFAILLFYLKGMRKYIFASLILLTILLLIFSVHMNDRYNYIYTGETGDMLETINTLIALYVLSAPAIIYANFKTKKEERFKVLLITSFFISSVIFMLLPNNPEEWIWRYLMNGSWTAIIIIPYSLKIAIEEFSQNKGIVVTSVSTVVLISSIFLPVHIYFGYAMAANVEPIFISEDHGTLEQVVIENDINGIVCPGEPFELDRLIYATTDVKTVYDGVGCPDKSDENVWILIYARNQNSFEEQVITGFPRYADKEWDNEGNFWYMRCSKEDN